MMDSLSTLIHEKRTREGLTLREAGTASGVAFSTLAQVERGAKPTPKTEQLIRAWLEGKPPLIPLPPMSLRDWFAGQALAGEAATQGDCIWKAADLAERAYAVADAMLAEREKSS